MARSVACVTATVELLCPLLDAPVTLLGEHLVENLNRNVSRPVRLTVTESCSTTALVLLEREVEELRHRFCTATHIRPRRGTSLDTVVLNGLVASGLSVPDLTAKSLGRHRRNGVVKLAERLLATANFAAWVRGGELARALTEVFDTHPGSPSVSIDGAVRDANATGIDGERLAWAVIGIESVRHQNLLWREVNRFAKRLPDRTPDDLLTYAWQGLRKALRNYNPETAMFSTYACPKIRGAIRDGVRAEHHLPKRLTTFVNKTEQGREKLTALLGRHPTLAELAESLDVELEKLKRMPVLAAPASIEELNSGEGAREHAGIVEHVEDDALFALLQDAVHGALAGLDPLDAKAVQLLVMEELPIGEVQQRTGMSARQLRTRRDKALAALGERLAAWQD